MKQSDKLDIICATKILRHIQSITDAYKVFNIVKAEDFKVNHICQLAVAQAMTNIYELWKKLQAETIEKMPNLSTVRLKATRNIASHDYDSLDFDILYNQTQKLMKPEIRKELEAVINVTNPCDSGN